MSEVHDTVDDEEQMTDDDNVPVLGKTRHQRANTILTCRRLMIVPVTVGYFLSIGIATYVIPEYIHQRLDEDYVSSHSNSALDNYTFNACLSNKSSSGYERYTYVQQETANWQNYLSIARVTPSIFSTLIWASYSDVVGRKALIVTSLSGCAAKLLALTMLVYLRTHIAWLILGEVIEGVTGTFSTFFAVVFSFVADTTELGQTRTIAIVFIELLVGSIFAIASLSTGYYIKYAGFFAPSITALGCVLVAIVVTTVLLPETLRERKPGGFGTLATSISSAFKLFFKPESRLIQIKYFLLLFSFMLYTFQGLNRGTLETLYQLGQPFCWSSTKIGWFAFARVSILSLVGIGGAFILKKCLADDTIALLSCFVTAGSYIVEGFAKAIWVLYTVPVFAMLSMLPIPMMRSLMSHLTPPEKQGAMFSVFGTCETLCSLLGALTTNLVYSATLSIMNGFVFLVLALVTSISGTVLGVFMCVHRCHTDQKEVNLQKADVIQPEKY